MRDNERPGQSPGLLRAVVLGGYGLIGAAVMRGLEEAGFAVTGIGRSGIQARRSAPDADWEIFDIGTMSAEGWAVTLKDVAVVVNASGALQDGGRDDLSAIHETALQRIGEALRGSDTLFVQISAAGVAHDATTEFFRSKARGEAALRAADVSTVTLRPTLVLAPGAYGGTALLRAAAAIPLVLPRIFPRSKVQCVLIDDLVQAVVDSAKGRIEPGTVADVTAEDAVAFPDLLRAIRRWQGFPAALVSLPVPGVGMRIVGKMADLAGRMGWRPPLRSTALQVLRDGVRGDASQLAAAGGKPCRSLDDILRALPATLQERWFARTYLLFPLAVLGLSIFWIASGILGIFSFEQAKAVLTSRGWGPTSAGLAVVAGSIVDVSLGALILWRSRLRRAALGMIAVSIAYLAGGTWAAPDLWLDPLGPLVKILPGILLTLFVLALADDR